MNRALFYLVAWLVLVLAATADLVAHYPQLPERVATHFGASGAADGWSTRQSFLWGWIVTLGTLPLIIGGAGFLVTRIPARFINMPHRDYWLAPGRIEYSRGIVANLVQQSGLALFAFLVSLNHVIMRANLTGNPHVGAWPWILMGLLFVALGAIIIPTMRSFQRRQ